MGVRAQFPDPCKYCIVSTSITMARGGGTGSRNNKKKKTADVVPQNGSVEVSRPLKAPQANGGATDNDVANINKHKNKHNRKQKEETPPTLAADEETKDEKTKLVPTSEQLRLAQITQSQDNSMDPQRKAKISQVIDITGKLRTRWPQRYLTVAGILL